MNRSTWWIAGATVFLLLPGATPGAARGQPPADDPTGAVLARRVAALRAEAEALDAQIAQLQERMPRVDAEIDRLVAEIGALRLPESEKEEADAPTDAKPRQVEFRPPIVQQAKSDTETPLAIVCENGRASILDLEEQGAAFEKLAANKDELQRFVDNGGGTLPAGDFEIKISILVIGTNVLLTQEATRKPGFQGETLASGYPVLSSRLASLSPEKTVIQFVVYPDSFEVFRAVRKKVWDGNFKVNWIPIEHGNAIPIGDHGPIYQ